MTNCTGCPFERQSKGNDVCRVRCAERRMAYLKYIAGVIPFSDVPPQPTDFSNPNFLQPYVHSSGGKFLNKPHYEEVARALGYADETEMFVDITARVTLIQAIVYFEAHGHKSSEQSIKRRCAKLGVKLERQKKGITRPIYM